MIEGLTVRKAVELAITTEQLGADYYTRMERKFGDMPELKEIFAQLTKDEKAHEAQFRAILKHVPEDKPEDQQYELYQYLRATAVSEFFHKDYFKTMEDVDAADKALGHALAFEKATLQFYQAIQDILGDNKELDSIIKAERGHVLALMKVIMSDAKFRGMGDKW
jgi:rubrerythrin